jgi:hypothetical protein
MQFQKVLRTVLFRDLPNELRDDWKYRKVNFQKNIQINSDYLIKNNLISSSFVDQITSIMIKYVDNGALQHHDIVPWHIGRLQDGSLLLIDTGWAGWSLKYYDFSYTALQLIGYTDRAEDAKTLLKNAKKLYGHEINYDLFLKTSLYYRGIRLAKELHEAKIGTEKSVIDFISRYQ